MTATDFTRRNLLAALPGLALAGAAVTSPSVFGRSAGLRLYSAATAIDGSHYLCGWSASGPLFQTPAPGRGHDVLVTPNEVIFFARRPGNWFCVLDGQSGELLHTRRSSANRHFYGHGALSMNARYLYTTENDVARSGKGIIGVYDCRDGYRRVSELPSGGIGPHQLALMPDGNTLVVANGGILTLPDRPREKLNIDSMQPALSYIDIKHGKVMGNWQPPHHQLSLRHLDVNDKGVVTVGAQFEGPQSMTLPLLFAHRGEEQLQAFDADTPTWQSHRQYIASVVSAGNTVLATSPRGDCISRWQNGVWQRSDRLNDVAGAAYLPHSGEFLISNGRGQLVRVGNDNLALFDRSPTLQWDNHMSVRT